MIRVVRAPAGRICVDETGKAHGRGAYLCRNQACWEKGIGQAHSTNSSALAHALKGTLSETDRAALLDYARRLPDMASTDENHSEGVAQK